MRWIIGLRWIAMFGILLTCGFAFTGAFEGVNFGVILGIGVTGLLYNVVLFRAQSKRKSTSDGPRAAMFQAIVDISILTGVLWAAGGVSSPFIAYYVFHVALVGILGGPRAAFLAAGVSCVCALFLSLTHTIPALQIGHWSPTDPWDLVADIGAFTTTVVGIAYIVTHTLRELRERESALYRARDQLALEYQLLSNTLDELEAGLEVVDEKHRIIWRNKRAEQLGPNGDNWTCSAHKLKCEQDESGQCPYKNAHEHGSPGHCRFRLREEKREKVYEMLSFPLSVEGSETPRVMNLYVDRTQATLDDRRLMTTERLVSLGRVAQGVAHELNTPLATIRTLAADMRVAFRSLSVESDSTTIADVDESAALIHDETRRLGRIAQALLAGGDLVRPQVNGMVPLGAIVERARALVFAGAGVRPNVSVESSVRSVTVTADPDRLVQVLVNLLQNAYDAVREQPDGHVRISAAEHGKMAVVSISDNGTGIDKDIASRLFEPFATSKPPGQGTGLGLYTSYMLVQAMDGDLSLASGELGGAIASLTLPRVTAE